MLQKHINNISSFKAQKRSKPSSEEPTSTTTSQKRQRKRPHIEDDDKEWIREGLHFLARIVTLQHPSDIFNKMRFEKFLLTAKKLLRIVLQSSWNQLDKDSQRFIIGCLDVPTLLENANLDGDENGDELDFRCDFPPNQIV